MKKTKTSNQCALFSLALLAVCGRVKATELDWKNTGSDFNAAVSYTQGTTMPGAGTAEYFKTAEMSQPVVTSSVTTSGLYFSVGGYDLTNANSAILTLTGYGTSATGSTASAAAAIYSSITSGSNVIEVPIQLAANNGTSNSTIYQTGNGGTLIINGKISGTTTTTALYIASGGTVALNGVNDFSTGISLTGAATPANGPATLAIGNNSALGTGTLTVSNACTLTASGGARSISNSVVLAADGVIGGSNALILSGDFTSSGYNNRILTVNNTGNTTLSGNVFLSESNSKGRTLSIAGTGAVAISGIVTDFNGSGIAGSLTYSGSNTLTLSGTNTYSGSTTVSGGGTMSVGVIHNAGASGNLGTGATINLGAAEASGELLYTGKGETTNKVINLNGTTGGGTVDQSGTGILTFTSDLSVTGAGFKTLTLQGSTTGTGVILGKVADSDSGPTSLSKLRTGTWILGGANTYTGTTTVTAGMLLVNGSTGASAVTVTGGTLGGTGTVNNEVTVNGGAILQGGAGTAAGALTLTNPPMLNAGSIIQITLDASLNHSKLAFPASSNPFNANQVFNFTGAPVVGLYDNIITGVSGAINTSGWTINNGFVAFRFIDDGSNIDLMISDVPEPATVLGGALMAGAFGWIQRRRLRLLVGSV